MIKYYTTEGDYLASINYGQELPEHGVEMTFDIGESPSPYHSFNVKTMQWVNLQTVAQQWGVVRQTRDELLSKSDWTQLPDAPDESKAAWATYRQALRDITNQPDPTDIEWPVRP